METHSITQFGKYHLIRHLAHGGMSDIYLARDESAEQLYALKLVKQDTIENYRHFRRELSILSTLKHEHILPIFDYCEEDDGTACYVTPYIEQGSLKERLSAGPLSLEEAATILSQVGEALQFIHEAGLVHRDIKPANILLDATNYVWLADFGLAKAANTPSDLTDTGCLIGTPYYIAPELLGEPASSSSDIYALGVVLYEMLTGTLPFTGQTPLMICWKHVYEQPPAPSALNPLISASVEQVILRALAKEPAERFASVRAMVEAYEEALLAPTVLIHPAKSMLDASTFAAETDTSFQVETSWPQPETLSEQRRRRPLAIAMVMLALLFVLSVATLAIEYQIQPSATANVGAQMISLPGALPITPAALATPTSTPTAHATPKPPGSTPATSQGSGPHKPNEHKHHKKDG